MLPDHAKGTNHPQMCNHIERIIIHAHDPNNCYESNMLVKFSDFTNIRIISSQIGVVCLLFPEEWMAIFFYNGLQNGSMVLFQGIIIKECSVSQKMTTSLVSRSKIGKRANWRTTVLP